MYQEPPESLEQQNDQAALPNLNAQWVNARGQSRIGECEMALGLRLTLSF
jgi:hypothetical protein